MTDESINYQNLAEENALEKVDNEKIIQELHSLKLQVAAKQSTINDYENELCTIQKDCETEILKMKSIHKLSETNWQERICLLENENRVLNDAYSDLLKREESLRLVVTDLQNKGPVSVRSEESDNDANLEASLRQELNNCMAEQELQDEINRLTTANFDLQRDKNRLEIVSSDLQLDLEEKNSELSAKDIQIAILKEDLLGTQALLDAERMQAGLPVKGNSLFSEVEDRRVVVEKQMVALRKENDALKFDLAATKNMLLITKNQWLSLDQLVSTEMERHLTEEQTRINYLTNQNQELIQELTELRSRTCLPIVFEDDGDAPSNKKIQKFLELTLKNKTDELAQVYSKLSKQDLLNTSLVSSTRDLEKQVHRANQKIFALQASVGSLKSALIQLRQKYEPETLIEKCLDPAPMLGEEVPKNRPRISDSFGKTPGEPADSCEGLLLTDRCEVVPEDGLRMSDGCGKTRWEPADSLEGSFCLRDSDKSGTIGADAIKRSADVPVLNSVRCSHSYLNLNRRLSECKENVEFGDQLIGALPKESKLKTQRQYASRIPRAASSLTANSTENNDSKAWSIEASKETIFEQILEQSDCSVEATDIHASFPTLDNMPDTIHANKLNKIGDCFDTPYLSIDPYDLPHIDSLKSANRNQDGKRKVSFMDGDVGEEKEGGRNYCKTKGPTIISKYIKVDVKDNDTSEPTCNQQ